MSSQRLQESAQIAALKQAATFDEMLQVLNSSPTAAATPLLRRAALARTFNQELYTAVISPVAAEQPESFEQFIARCEIAPVAHAEGWYRLSPAEELRELKAWGQDLEGARKVSAELLRWLAAQAPAERFPELALPHRLFAEPTAAASQLEAVCREADERFDLPRLESWLALVCPRIELLATDHPARRVFARWNARLAARKLFQRDYYQTATYFKPEALHATFNRWLSAREAWVGEIYAPGGFGKSMFLKAWLARELIPRGIPVARLDFDDVEYRHLASQPWLALLPLCQQLAVQLPGAFFSRVLMNAPSWDALLSRRPEDACMPQPTVPSDDDIHVWGRLFGDGFPAAVDSLPHTDGPVSDRDRERRPLLVFDTTEEPYLHGPDVFSPLLKLLHAARSAVPGLKVLLAGRYELFGRTPRGVERVPGLLQQIGSGRWPSQALGRFTDDEAYLYLTERRGLSGRPDLARAIVQASGGLPLKLALWADEATEDPRRPESERLRPQVVTQSPQIEIHVLIQRVIQRIPATPDELPVRWALRYAAAFRRLTPEIFASILVPVLKHAVSLLGTGQELDDPDLTLPERWKRKEIWAQGNPGSSDILWQALQKYASHPGLSWLEWSPAGELRLHLEVLNPMRTLLRGQKVWDNLHRQAVEVFSQASGPRETDARWANRMADCVYHAFQVGPEEGARAWKLARTQAASRPASALAIVARVLLGGDFFEDEECFTPRLAPATQMRLVPEVVEAEAHLALAEEAAIAAILARRPEDRSQRWAAAQRAWERLKTRGDEPIVAPELLKRLLDTAIYRVQDGRAADETWYQTAIEVLNSFRWAPFLYRASRSTMYAVLLELSQAQFAELGGKQAEAVTHFLRAAKGARKLISTSRITTGAIYDQCAAGLQRIGAVDEASQLYDELLKPPLLKQAMDIRRQAEATAQEADVALECSRVWTQLGELAKAQAVLSPYRSAADPAQSVQLARLQWEAGQPPAALEILDQIAAPENAVTVRKMELRAVCCSALARFRTAHTSYEESLKLALQLGLFLDAGEIALARIQYCLDVVGDFRAAQSLLALSVFEEPEVLVRPWWEHRRRLLELRWGLLSGRRSHAQSKAEFGNLWKATEADCNPRQQAHLLAYGLLDDLGNKTAPRRFAAALEALQPPASRLLALQPFRNARNGAGNGHARQLLELFEPLRERLEEGNDLPAAAMIWLADFERWLGFRDLAAHELKLLERRIEATPDSPWLGTEHFRAVLRLDPGLLGDPLQAFGRLTEQLNTSLDRRSRSLWADPRSLRLVTAIELAEQAPLAARGDAIELALGVAEQGGNDDLEGTDFEPRLRLLRAHARGVRGDARQDQCGAAAELWRTLGNPSAARLAIGKSPWRAHYWVALQRNPAAMAALQDPVRFWQPETRSDPTLRIAMEEGQGIAEYTHREAPTSWTVRRFPCDLLRSANERTLSAIDRWGFEWLDRPDVFRETMEEFFASAAAELEGISAFRLLVPQPLLQALPWEAACPRELGVPCRVQQLEREARPAPAPDPSPSWDVAVMTLAQPANAPLKPIPDACLERLSRRNLPWGLTSPPRVQVHVWDREKSILPRMTQMFLQAAASSQLFLLHGALDTLSRGSEIYLNVPGRAMSARELGKTLASRNRRAGGSRTVVVLETPLSSSPHVARRAILLRNLFASELFHAGQPLAIIACALPDEGTRLPGDYADSFAEQLLSGNSLAEIVAWLRRPEHGWAASSTALFTEDPTASVAPSPP